MKNKKKHQNHEQNKKTVLESKECQKPTKIQNLQRIRNLYNPQKKAIQIQNAKPPRSWTPMVN